MTRRIRRGGNSEDFQLMYLGDVDTSSGEDLVDGSMMAWNESAEKFKPAANISAALGGAASPSASNVYATMADAGISMSDYANVVVVDVGGQGDYTTLAAALASITNATATNRYGVIVMPGRYTVTTTTEVTMEGVDIIALIPGTVEIYSTTSLTNGILNAGLTRTVVSESLIYGINVTQNVNASNAALKISVTNSVNVRFVMCNFTKNLGGGSPVMNNAHASSTVSFDLCLIEHKEVTSTARAAVTLNNGSTPSAELQMKIYRSVLRVHSTSATASAIYDTIGDATYKVVVYDTYASVPNGEIVLNPGEGAITTFRMAKCVLTRDVSATYFTNQVTTPYNVVDANF